jgi:hypothetical protein
MLYAGMPQIPGIKETSRSTGTVKKSMSIITIKITEKLIQTDIYRSSQLYVA